MQFESTNKGNTNAYIRSIDLKSTDCNTIKYIIKKTQVVTIKEEKVACCNFNF
jgi:hypothetical protein